MIDTNCDAPKPFYADAQAFFGFPGQPPRIEQGTLLDLALVRCAPPAGPHAQSLEMTLAACKEFKAQLMATGAARIITGPKEVDISDGRVNIVLGLQNLPHDMGKRTLDWFSLRNTGVRVISLVYDKVNAFGSGCLNLDVGLTTEGEKALCHMQDHGFILDLSHAGHRMAREVLEAMDRRNIDIPVMASHVGCYSVYPHFRNLPDDVLVGIAKRGGVIGIANLTFILDHESNGADPFLYHLLYARRKCGAESIVIGSDAPYVTYTAHQEQVIFEKMKQLNDPHGTWGSRSPMYTPGLAGPAKMTKIEDRMPDVGILGLNLLNFFERSLPK